MACADVSKFPLIAVDVGNSRVKFGVFEHPLSEVLPHPQRALAARLDQFEEEIPGWLPNGPEHYHWSIASVNRPATVRLIKWLEEHRVSRIQLLTHADLPVQIDLPRADLVGLDRLANAVAVNQLRSANEPAIVVDLGTAMKVDLVSATGAFAGGAIMPGLSMSARALHEFTDLLPAIEVAESPEPLGKSTLAAMSSGLYWGSVGAIHELIARLSPGPTATQVFLTGGAAPKFVSVLGHEAQRPPQFVPHLTLAGIALAALRAEPAKG